MNNGKGEISSIFKTRYIVKRRLMKEFGQELRQRDLAISSGMTLHIIIVHGRLTMSELHDMTGFERGSLTPVVDSLIGLGFVESKR